MNDPLYSPAPDHIERALEAVCATVITLEVIRATVPDESPVSVQTVQAIRSLRGAIAELRTATAAGIRQVLPKGFVLPGGDAPEPGLIADAG